MRALHTVAAVLLSIIAITREASAQVLTLPNSGLIRDSEHALLVLDSDTELRTDVLLRALNWDSLTAACTTRGSATGPCFASIQRDGLLTYYEYGRPGYRTRTSITDYRGTVLSYDSHIESSLRPVNTTYFDKPAWIRYAHEILGPDADSMRISVDEPAEVLKAYYRLLGAGVRNEYGWICEYSTVGMAPAQRQAAIHLILATRTDLLRRILRGPNLVGQVYAADALLYLDYRHRHWLEEFMQYRNREMQGLDSTALSPERRQGLIDRLDSERKEFEAGLLTQEDRAAIDSLRASSAIVRTCGNAGSFRIYPLPVSEVLSDSAIARIPEEYEALRESGYFHQ